MPPPFITWRRKFLFLHATYANYYMLGIEKMELISGYFPILYDKPKSIKWVENESIQSHAHQFK